MLSGVLRMKRRVGGRTRAEIRKPRDAQELRQPIRSMRKAVTGTKTMTPTLLPTTVMAKARPRILMNHLETTVVVTILPNSWRPSAKPAVNRT